MGSVSAMESIDRVIRKHGSRIRRELRREYKSRLIRRFTLSNQTYEIAISAELADGTWLELKPLDIDGLAERYPDCKVGY
jgi:hypothetical protein